MNTQTSKQSLILGFGAIITIIFSLTLVWLYHTKLSLDNMSEINSYHTEISYIHEIHGKILSSSYAINHLASAKVLRERNQYLAIYNDINQDLLETKNHYFNLNLTEPEREKWMAVLPLIKAMEDENKKLIKVIAEKDKNQVMMFLHEKVMPAQEQAMLALNELLTLHSTEMTKATSDVSIEITSSVALVGILGFVAFVIGTLIARKVINTTQKTERDLIAAQEGAFAANRLKSVFLANMSHEIRTPLTSILGYAEALIEQGQTEEEKRQSTYTIIRNGDHLLQIINDILDLSKIESEKLEIEKLDVSPFEMLAEAEALNGYKARENGLHFSVRYDYPIPSLINTDPTRYKQIVFNLLSNALKFTKQGEIQVTCSFDKEHGTLVTCVRDSGIGMSQDELKRVFQPFSQADETTTRKYGGTGLGLTISKQLAKMLGGDLNVKSEKGIGTEFILKIDVGLVLESHMLTALPSGQELVVERKPTKIPELTGHILLAEDSRDTQALVSMYIKRTGAQVTVVDNGKQAVEAALVNSFDLILMDIQMPVMDGVEATEWLRKSGSTKPIVAFTANAMKEEQDHYLAVGVNEILSKPIDRNIFYNVISRYLESSESQTQPVVDLEQDEEFKEMVFSFKESLPVYLHELKQALEQQDSDTVSGLAHKLKGLGGSFGFQEITSIAARIETLAKEHLLEKASTQLIELNQFCEKINAT